MELKSLLEQSILGKVPNPVELPSLWAQILDGQIDDVELGALLTAWRCHGETEELLTSGAAALVNRATAVPGVDSLRPFADNCGTGGDSSGSFNISTFSAIVAASAGIRILKHGNRSISSKSGSADVLQAMGYPLDLTPGQSAELFKKSGLAFLFAPGFHPSMKHVMPVRQKLGVRTIFNLLGPLANPAQPDIQLIGVADQKYLQPFAGALRSMNRMAWAVVHSDDGLDEISSCAKTEVVFARAGAKEQRLIVDPIQLECDTTREDILGGDPHFNASVFERILAGENSRSARVLALNAGMLLFLSHSDWTFEQCVSKARRVITDGTTSRYCKGWILEAQKIRSEIST